jgi:AraC-like DNA-binding protein
VEVRAAVAPAVEVDARDLAEQVPVSAAARLVGYRTTSAYVAAFRAHTGVTPGRYFQPPSAPSLPKRATGGVPVEDLADPGA